MISAVIISIGIALNAQSNRLTLRVGYPIAGSERTFKDMYTGIASTSLYASHMLSNNWVVGGGVNYDVFGPKYSEIFNTKAHFISPALLLGYNLGIARITFTPKVIAGYSFIRFTNIDYPDVNSNNKSGFGLRAGIDVVYALNNKFDIGLYLDYKFIFAKFLKDVPLVNESSNTRYSLIGIAVNYKF